MALSDALRAAIRRFDGSPAELARRCGLHRSQLSRFLAGHDLTTSAADKIARELGLSLVEPSRQSKSAAPARRARKGRRT